MAVIFPESFICRRRWMAKPAALFPTNRLGRAALFFMEYNTGTGRPVEKLTGSLPLRSRNMLCECFYEDLVSPSRVNVDVFGNV